MQNLVGPREKSVQMHTSEHPFQRSWGLTRWRQTIQANTGIGPVPSILSVWRAAQYPDMPRFSRKLRNEFSVLRERPAAQAKGLAKTLSEAPGGPSRKAHGLA